VWVDVDGIRDAEVFPDALRRAIESSDAFVFVISPDAVRSEFCEQEVAHAAALNKPDRAGGVAGGGRRGGPGGDPGGAKGIAELGNPHERGLISGVIGLARSLGIDTVAEGVEHEPNAVSSITC
jgi:TIR domain